MSPQVKEWEATTDPAPSRVEERDTTSAPSRQVSGDRRRQGRIENISPNLIPLLRQPTVVAEPTPAGDDLRLPKGIAFGILLAIPLWAAIIVGISLALR